MKILLTSAEIVALRRDSSDAGACVPDESSCFPSAWYSGSSLQFPVLAAEFLVEIGVGILNKIVPQINVFVINIQLKVIVGLGLLCIVDLPDRGVSLNLVTVMVKAIQEILTFL